MKIIPPNGPLPTWVGLILGGLGMISAPAAITYDPAAKVIVVTGYPEVAPATMDTLWQVDQQNRWGVVAYDRTADTYRVQASLYIGTNTDLGTYFQIGRPDHPRETVLVQGDVWVKPPKKSLQREDGFYAIMNRLTLGNPNDANIQATLKIACAKAGEYALMLGFRNGPAQVIPGPALHVYNSVITAATLDNAHRVAGQKTFPDGNQPAWYASEVRLINARLSWFTEMYGIENAVFEGSTFEHVNTVFSGYSRSAKKCVFKNCEKVIGCRAVTLIQCVFANNQYNWVIDPYSSGLTLVDCRLGPQARPLSIKKSRLTSKETRGCKALLYPSCTEWISLPIQVTDSRGRPIAKAFVNVSCPDDPDAVRNGFTLTDRRGLTPADPENQAILIIRKKLQATDEPDRPRDLAFVYTIAVSAPGFLDQRLLISHGQDLPRPLVVKLAKPSLFLKLKNALLGTPGRKR